MRTPLLALTLALWLAPAAHATAPTRLLYASDWNGPTQIFAADPNTGRTVGQLTFGRTTPTCSLPVACGFMAPLPSPNGKKIAYLETAAKQFESPWILWIADSDGRHARRVGDTTTPIGSELAKHFRYAVWSPDSTEIAYRARAAPGGVAFARVDGRPNAKGRWFHSWPEVEIVVSPDRRWIASAKDNQLVVTNRRSGRVRVLLKERVSSPAWAPDSRSLAFVEGRLGLDTDTSGDIGVVTLSGQRRTVVHGRGQVESVAWTKPPPKTPYRAAEAVNGVFAGGPIARLAADGGRVVYASCLDVHAWTPSTGVTTTVTTRPDWISGACLAPDRRDEVYDLAIAGDRVAWGLKTSGLSFHWWLYQTHIATASVRYPLVDGSNAVGSNWYGAGALAGSGSGIVYSTWNTNRESGESDPVMAMTLFRATTEGCPCPAIAYGAERHSIAVTPIAALDTDGRRIAAVRYSRLVVLDDSGTELAAFDVRPAAAQLVGEEVVVLVPNELRIYSVTGAFHRSWTMPSASVGRDCRYYSEPRCPYRAELTLQDGARGLAAYVFGGVVHVLRLSDGHDTVVGPGIEARFMDDGLVYADGARIRLIQWSALQ